jgi:alpha-tubulin suppressor-like RCC1 family protein
VRTWRLIASVWVAFAATQIAAACNSGEKVAPAPDAGTSNDAAPAPPMAAEGGVTVTPTVSIAAGGDTACAISETGVLKCWGHGRAPALTVLPGSTFVRVAVGSSEACAIRKDRALLCWPLDTFAPELRHPGPITDLSVGHNHGCAISAEGALHCWGSNRWGQLGLGPDADGGPSEIARVPSATKWRRVNAGDAQTCALDVAGTLYCWGQGAMNGAPIDASTVNPSPVAIRAPYPWRDLGIGQGQCTTDWSDKTNEESCRSTGMCAISADGGDLHCWGGVVRPVSLGWPVERVRTGAAGLCFVRTDGLSSCFGKVAGAGADATELAVGEGFACKVGSDGGIGCWGDARRGQLASTKYLHTIPQRVGAPGEWTFLATLAEGACAVKTNGVFYCWGSGNEWPKSGVSDAGLPGSGADGGTKWVSISPSRYAGVCGIADDSNAWCTVSGGVRRLNLLASQLAFWGDYGVAIGSDGTLYRWTPGKDPVQVDADTWKHVSTAGGSTCAIRADGTLWCWWAGFASPVQQMSADTTWSVVTMSLPGGGAHAIKDGSLFLVEPSGVSPVQDGTSWKTSAHAWPRFLGEFRCGIRQDGALACAGANGEGQLGNGTLLSHDTPETVGSARDWVTVAVGHEHACGLRSNGDLYCWGSYARGQLGNGPGWVGAPLTVPLD